MVVIDSKFIVNYWIFLKISIRRIVVKFAPVFVDERTQYAEYV